MTTLHEVGTLDDYTEKKPRRWVLDGEDVLVVKVDGEVFATSDICSHGEVSLSEGEIEGCAIECWLHGSSFDLSTGVPSGPPATTAIATYPVTLEGDDNPKIYVSLTETARS